MCFTQIQHELNQIKDKPIELKNSTQLEDLANLFIEQYKPYHSFKEQTKWFKKCCEILNPHQLDEWLPIRDRGHLAYEYLSSIQSKHEMVRGAFKNYAQFIKQHYQSDQQSTLKLESNIITWCKHLCSKLSQNFGYATPFHHLDSNPEHLLKVKSELAHDLNLSHDELMTISKSCVSQLQDNWQKYIHQPTQAFSPIGIFSDSQHIKDLYFQQLTKFFAESRYFRSGLARFQVWMNRIHHIFNSSLMEQGYDFFEELEIELRKFCRVIEIKIKPRINQDTSSIQSYFSYFLDENSFGEEIFSFHYKHLIADVFILDKNNNHSFFQECHHFLELVFNHLLIQYSQDIWELLKTNSEVARKEIALQIKTDLPKDQINTELLTLKAKILDELYPNFDEKTEFEKVQLINFGLSNSQSPFQLIETEDYNYWYHKKQKTHLEIKETKEYLNKLQRVIKAEWDRLPQQNNALTFYQLKGSDSITSHYLCRFVDFNDGNDSVLWIHIQQTSLELIESVLQNFHDKGATLDLTRFKISQHQPFCLHLLNAFNSDTQQKAMSQLTHLRPSLLKKFGSLLEKYQQEIEELKPKSPPPFQESFEEFNRACTNLWKSHEHELTTSLRLPQATLKKFQMLRQQAEKLKCSMRLRCYDLIDMINNLKLEQNFFEIKEPKLFIDLESDQYYFSWSQLKSFLKHIEEHPNRHTLKFKSLFHRLNQLNQAWFIHNKEWLYEGIKNYIEELSQEPHHQKNIQKPIMSFTIFFHQQDLPEPHQSAYPSLALECFTEGQSKEGAHHRVVQSAGAGYEDIFTTYFKEFSAIAHRNIIIPSNKSPFMESFFRIPSDEASLHDIDPSMLKQRFHNHSGLSTLFFFPCKSFHSNRTLNHKF